MDRHLFIVAKDQPDLYAYLQQQFSSEPNVEIILDRRRGSDRRSTAEMQAERQHPNGGPRERRGGDRRIRTSVEGRLRSLGYAMLRLLTRG